MTFYLAGNAEFAQNPEEPGLFVRLSKSGLIKVEINVEILASSGLVVYTYYVSDPIFASKKGNDYEKE
jgi:hypothetical protein